MTRLEYELLRVERTDLNLPDFWSLNPDSINLMIKLSRERLIARRTAVILSREDPALPDPHLARLPDEI